VGEVIEFNPNCRITVQHLRGGSPLVVVDDALLNPQRLVDMARGRAADMALDSRWHYPGMELALPEADVEPSVRFFRRHLREQFAVSRIVRQAYARLSMVTLPAEKLSWVQRMCHTDGLADLAGDRIIASVLYLFQDPALGGTAFFEPRPGVQPYHQLLRQGRPVPGSEKYAFFQQPPAYHTDSNEFFILDQVVPAQWNRMIFYRGDVHHSGHISAPERLSPDPGAGRLTLNGFYRVAGISV
jgi:hypothetical protein